MESHFEDDACCAYAYAAASVASWLRGRRMAQLMVLFDAGNVELSLSNWGTSDVPRDVEGIMRVSASVNIATTNTDGDTAAMIQ